MEYKEEKEESDSGYIDNNKVEGQTGKASVAQSLLVIPASWGPSCIRVKGRGIHQVSRRDSSYLMYLHGFKQLVLTEASLEADTTMDKADFKLKVKIGQGIRI